MTLEIGDAGLPLLGRKLEAEIDREEADDE